MLTLATLGDGDAADGTYTSLDWKSVPQAIDSIAFMVNSVGLTLNPMRGSPTFRSQRELLVDWYRMHLPQSSLQSCPAGFVPSLEYENRSPE